MTVGYKGGLSSRAAYVVASEEELPQDVADWLPRLAIPYYHTVVTWLENLHIGMRGGDVYRLVEKTLEQKNWNWHLKPGHLVADEEWLCSRVYPDSKVPLASGMLFQIDIIPSLPGYGGSSIEDPLRWRMKRCAATGKSVSAGLATDGGAQKISGGRTDIQVLTM